MQRRHRSHPEVVVQQRSYLVYAHFGTVETISVSTSSVRNVPCSKVGRNMRLRSNSASEIVVSGLHCPFLNHSLVSWICKSHSCLSVAGLLTKLLQFLNPDHLSSSRETRRSPDCSSMSSATIVRYACSSPDPRNDMLRHFRNFVPHSEHKCGPFCHTAGSAEVQRQQRYKHRGAGPASRTAVAVRKR